MTSEIRAMTDLHDANRALQDLYAKERMVEEELEGLLERRSDLEQGLGTLKDSSQVIEKLEVDAKLVSDNVTHTSKLASRLSSRVRRLDGVQTRIKNTLARIDAILDRNGCLSGVNQSMDEQDYEKAAGFVGKFLKLDDDVGNLPYLDTRQLSEQKASMMASRARLEEIVRDKFREAAKDSNHVEVFRYGKLYPLLGLREEGLQAITSYVRGFISARARKQFEVLSDALVDADGKESKVDFVGVLSAHFKDIAAAISENEAMLVESFGEGALLQFILAMHEECDSRGTVILRRFCEHNSIEKLVKEVGTTSIAHSQSSTLDPREVEAYLQEVLLLCERSEEYITFILARVASSSPGQVISPKETGRIRGGAFSVAVKELISYYIALEEYYLEESISTAIRISEAADGALTTSMVDDVFYILKKCGKRAMASGNLQCILATMNFAINLLTNKYKEKLAAEVRGCANKLLADAPDEYGTLPSEDASKHAAPLNDLDVSADYSEKLRRELEDFGMEIYSLPTDQDRIKSALSELGKAASDFSHMSKSNVEQLAMGILSRLKPILAEVNQFSYELTEAMYGEFELNDPWALKLIEMVETSVEWLQPLLTSNLYDRLLQGLAESLTARLDALMMQKHFSQLGGLQFDKDIRNLISRLSSMTQGAVRDKFARLQQIAIVLNLENVHEILDSWGENAGSVSWRLSPAEVKKVMSLRTDFRSEDIARLAI